MRLLLLISYLLIGHGLFSQIVFLETFDEADDAVVGIDNTAGLVAWATLCPSCLAPGDYFKVIGNELVALDTNEPATFVTSATIDVSTCGIGLNISFDLDSSGDLEDCVDCPDPGTDCIDWVKLEYNLDGLGWTEVAGSACGVGMTAAPGEMVEIGDVAAGPITITSPCVDIGSDLELRITVLASAGDEFWYIDNITVECTDCLLPVKFENFKVRTNESGFNEILWTTLQERSNDFFQIERSIDGLNYQSIGKIDGAGNSVESINYSFTDHEEQVNQTVYYRVKQIDYNGNFTTSSPISIQNKELTSFIYANNQIKYHLSNSAGSYDIIIYNLNGTIVDERKLENIGTFNWNKKGLFLIEVPELGIRQKITTF